MAHMAYWTIEAKGNDLTVQFRQGDSIQDCGSVPRSEDTQLIGWLFHSLEGAKQFDYIHAPFAAGWVGSINLEKN